MATSEFTPHFHLDKYVATDKPNLRDQYNAAMDKIDSALYSSNDTALDAKDAARQATQDVTALKALLPDSDFSSQSTVKSWLDRIGNSLPLSVFNSSNTVEDAIQQAGLDLDAVKALLPATDFSAQSTVKNWLDRIGNALPLNEFNSSHTVADAIRTVQPSMRRSFVCFGDSYGSGTYRRQDDSGYGNSPNGWLTYMESVIGPYGWCDVVTNRSSIVAGNSGFTSSGTFLACLNDMLSRHVIANPESVTDVVCLAGTNDIASGEQTILNAVTTFCARVREVMPNANIRIGVFANNISGTNHVAKAYKRGCEMYGGHYIGSTRYLAHKRELISIDNVHPSADAYDTYLPYLLDVCFDGDCDYRIITPLTLNPTSGFTLTNTGARSVVTPDSFQIEFVPRQAVNPIMQLDGPVTAGQTIEIGVPNMPFMPSYSEPIADVGLYANIPVPNSAEVYWNLHHVGYGYVMGSTPTTLRVTKPRTSEYGTGQALVFDAKAFNVYGEAL